MRQSGKDRAFAKLILAFAEKAGCSRRTAQRYAATDHPDWTRFCQGTATAAVARRDEPGVLATAVLPPPPPVVTLPSEDMSEPERVMRTTYDMLWSHVAQWKQSEGALAMAQAQVVVKLREAYFEALRDYEQWLVDQRGKIPAGEFHAFRAGFLKPMATLLENMPAQIGPLANPKDSAFAIRVVTEFMVNTVQPQLERMIDAVDKLVPPLHHAEAA